MDNQSSDGCTASQKKELLRDDKNGGNEWRYKGTPEEVRAYAFIDKTTGKGRMTPYGVFGSTTAEGGSKVPHPHEKRSDYSRR